MKTRIKKVDAIKIIVIVCIMSFIVKAHNLKAGPSESIKPFKIVALSCETEGIDSLKTAEYIVTAVKEEFDKALGNMGFLCIPTEESEKADVKLLVKYSAEEKGEEKIDYVGVRMDCRLTDSQTDQLIFSGAYNSNSAIESSGNGFITVRYFSFGSNVPKILSYEAVEHAIDDFQIALLEFLGAQPVSSWIEEVIHNILSSSIFEHETEKVVLKALELMGDKEISEDACVFYSWVYINLNNSREIRKAAIRALGRSGDQNSIELIIISLIIDEVNRKEAARSLMFLDKDGIYTKLVLAWNRDIVSIVDIAQNYLSKEKLIKELRSKWGLKKSIVIAEAMLGLDRGLAVHMFSSLLEELNQYETDKRIRCIEHLGRLKELDVVDILLSCLIDKDEKIRLAVVKALRNKKSDKSINVLKEIVSSDESKDVRFEAETLLNEFEMMSI